MIVFDLKCDGGGHVFEAWFASSSAYEDQRARHLIACPLCGDTAIGKALMAPHVSAKGNRKSVSPTAVQVTTPAEPGTAEVKAFLGAMAKAQAAMLEASEWVGRDFTSQARAMDAGEIDKATIHGEATPEEAKGLAEDGIAVLPLLIPVVPPGKRN
jgi:hypothetical protein